MKVSKCAANDGNAAPIEGALKNSDLAAPALLVAAKLACLNFERKNNSSASGDYLGDDDHEAWSALEKAVAQAEGQQGGSARAADKSRTSEGFS